MCSRLVTTVVFVCLIFLGLAVQGQDNDVAVPVSETSSSNVKEQTLTQDSAKYAELEQKIGVLKNDNQALEAREKLLSARNARIQKRIKERQSWIFVLKGGLAFLNPTRYLSPMFANLGYFFGAVALLALVVGWPATAGKVLSFRYPFILPTRKTGKDGTINLSATAKSVWVVILVLLLIILALPAFSQDEAKEGKEAIIESPVDEAAKDETAETPVESVSQESGKASAEKEATTLGSESEPAVIATPSIEPQINQALEYINFTALERTLHSMDNLSQGKIVTLTLEPELLRLLIESAKKNNHPCLIATPDPPTSPVTEDLREGSMGYFLLKASLYEVAGRDGVRDLLEKGAAPLIENGGAPLAKLNMQALTAIMLFLAAYESGDYVKVMVPFAINKAEQVKEIIMILEAVHKLDLSEAYRQAVEKIFERQQSYTTIESIFNLAMSHNRRETAEFIVESAIKHTFSALDDNLKVVRLLSKIADKTRVQTQLDALATDKHVNSLLQITETAHDLGFQEQSEALLVKALLMTSDRNDFQQIILSAEKLNLLTSVITPMGECLTSVPTRMLYKISASWPTGFNAALYEEENLSLGVWVAAHLYLQNRASMMARELFESTIRVQLTEIIESLGAKPLLALNDLYGLVHYYTEIEADGLNGAMKMVTLQRFLRGLSDVEASEYQEDPRLLALQMELDQQDMRTRRLQESIRSLEEQKDVLVQSEIEVTANFLMLTAEIVAKGILILLALWIAFARALAAGKTAPNFRFSNFCLTFTETVGFECCCTVILAVPGVLITLVSQDRLKHLRIMEYKLATIPSISIETGECVDSVAENLPGETITGEPTS